MNLKKVFIILGLILAILICGIKYIDFLNKNAGGIQTIATVILVIITAVYAYFTYKMIELVKKQIVPDIEISDIVIGSPFLEKEISEMLKSGSIKENINFEILLSFVIFNKGVVNASIQKPTLIIKFAKENYEFKILPKTKKIETKRVEYKYFKSVETQIKDLGNSIYIQGGQIKKFEIIYRTYNLSGEFLKHLQKNFENMKYFIEYYDNLSRKHLVEIKDVRPKNEVLKERYKSI